MEPEYFKIRNVTANGLNNMGLTLDKDRGFYYSLQTPRAD
jgi:hypothetical protein